MNSWNGRTYNFTFTDSTKPIRTFRSRGPAHFEFKIESWDKLKKSLNQANQKSFETPEFTAGEEKWTMCIYPEGNDKEGIKDFISLYLKRQPNDRGRNRAIRVSIKFFIGNRHSRNGDYLIIEDIGETRFSAGDDMWGIPDALEINHFENKTHGFLVADTCTFGAEVFVTSTEPQYSKLSPIRTISRRIFNIIKIGPFDNNTPEPVDSTTTFVTNFDGESYTWKLQLYREGYGDGSGSHFSLFLVLVDKSKLSNGRSMLVNFQLSFLSKANGAYLNAMTKLDWFSSSKDSSGFPEFIRGSDVFNSMNKFFDGGVLDVKVEFNSAFLFTDA